VTSYPLVRLACLVSFGVMLTACNATVVSGGLGGEGGGGGASGGAEPIVASSGGTGSGSSSGSGAPIAESGGVVIPDGEDGVRVLLGNFAQTCAAPQTEPPCAPGAWWLATIRMKTSHLVPGHSYPLNTGEVPIDLHERFDDCSGEGFAGWDGTPAYVTIDAVDTAHVVLTIEGAYPDVDGTWDVPLCGVTLP
jgi:hypothetical protein